MRTEDTDPKTPEEWLSLALRDLNSAEHKTPADKETIFFDSADSVEKSLKAFLCYSDIENLKRYDHRIGDLFVECKRFDKDFENIQNEVYFLTKVSYDNMSNCSTLYQTYNPRVIISEEQAEYSRKYARDVYEFVKSKIQMSHSR